MAPRQYVEKPLKIRAEQYLTATEPPIAGVCTIAHIPFIDGRPHAHISGQVPRELHDTDMIVWNYYHEEQIDDVVPVGEFEDRYGNVPGEVI